MRVVFIGASRFGLRCLESIRSLPGIELAGAVTAPQHFPISYRPEGVSNVLFADVGEYCGSHAIPCVAIGNDGMRDAELHARVKAWRPDAFLVAGWYHLVPKSWRELAPAYGLHASLLPDYSGGAPLVWAIINGEERTGITLFQLADGVDNGPIVGQAETEIRSDDTIATLYARIEELGVELLRSCLPKLADGSVELRPQDESRRRLVPQRCPEDGLINWNSPAARIHDFIRAQTRPYPGAFTDIFFGSKTTIWASRLSEAPSPGPAKLGGTADRPLIGCGDGVALEILAVALDGKDVPTADWWRSRCG